MIQRRPPEGIPAGITAHAQPLMPDWLEALAPSIWFPADHLTGIVDGGSVATYVDWSGNGRDATQATGAKQPTFKASDFAGKPTVRGDGSADRMATGAVDLSTATGLSIFAAIKDTETALKVAFSAGGGGTGFEFYPNGNGAGTFQFFFKGATSAARQIVSTAATYSLASPSVFGIVIDPAQSAASEVTLLQLNGSSIAFSFDAGVGVETSGGFGNQAIHLFARSTDTLFWAGDIADFILFDRPLSSQQAASVTSNLMEKYSL